jgi:hypothetical protein
MTRFSKSDECPSSHELNAFEQGEIALADGRTIRLHLRECDFCSAESDFYARFPQPVDFDSPEPVEHPTMPQPLRELAETMLNKHHGSSALESLLKTDKS